MNEWCSRKKAVILLAYKKKVRGEGKTIRE